MRGALSVVFPLRGQQKRQGDSAQDKHTVTLSCVHKANVTGQGRKRTAHLYIVYNIRPYMSSSFQRYDLHIKMAKGARSLGQTRFSRNTSDYDLHEMAGGLPLPALAAPNVHLSSKRRREVCNPAGKSNVPNI